MANRRGVLSKPDLSRVQSECLNIMMMLETQEKNKQENSAFRLAVVSGVPTLAETLFPEYFPKKVEVASTNEQVDDALSASDGTTKFEEMSEQDVEEVIKMLGISGKMKWDEVDNG